MDGQDKGIIHKIIRLFGVVQGVGFRPFVHRLAASLGVKGTVCNKGSYVEIEAEAPKETMETFINRLRSDAPPRAAILKIDDRNGGRKGYETFRIIPSEARSGDVFVSPDLATCPACFKEMYDPADRRFRHPFINCTACGPRLTILEGMPYDRVRTSMKAFPMCPPCEKEYKTIRSRRFHAQPVACPDCGPSLAVIHDTWPVSADEDERTEPNANDSIVRVRRVIREGGIAAVKGIGGFHLCCDALNAEAVQRLRALKDRPTRPFAVMARDLETAALFCEIEDGQEPVLTGPQKPILLLKKRPEREAATEAAAPGNPCLGVMLPYAPIHYLIFDDPADQSGEPMTPLLIMTSANRRGCPICRNDEEALQELRGMADLILTHDREIRIRADDSVMGWIGGKPAMLRRSRGYAPLPLVDSVMSRRSVLAMGGELKNAFALTKHDLIYPSAYLSDMADPRSLHALKDAVTRMETLLNVQPDVIAVDSHPAYHASALGREIAKEKGIPVVAVPHHFAHVVSGMAENDLNEPVIGVAFDGTGYGDDGTIWGGEFFRAERTGCLRLACLERVFQAGGDRAAIDGYRPAVSWLLKAYGDEADSVIRSLGLCSERERQAQTTLVRNHMNGVLSSSAGRLYDAASAILGVCARSTYEGEAAMRLEYAAMRSTLNRDNGGKNEGNLRIVREARELIGFIRGERNDGTRPGICAELSPSRLIRRLAEGRLNAEPAEDLAFLFHAGIAQLIKSGCQYAREKTGLRKVVLTGGTMQNRLLTEMCVRSLQNDGFEVYTHTMIPANDNGLAVGQAAAVAAGYGSGESDR